jgi:hypothetical protein
LVTHWGGYEMKNIKVLFFALLFVTANALYANSGINVNDPPDVRQGSNCAADVNCSIHVTLVIGYMMGIYDEKERLNAMICDSIDWKNAKTVQCVLKKYVSRANNGGCYEKTNTINVSFVNENIPKIDGQTGYKYSCK